MTYQRVPICDGCGKKIKRSQSAGFSALIDAGAPKNNTVKFFHSDGPQSCYTTMQKEAS